MDSNGVAERRIRREAKPIIDRYLTGKIDFEKFMNQLAQIDDAKYYEMAAAEEVD